MRNFIFGVEDSLVSTVGLLSGVAVAGTSRGVIILSGIVLIFVEAFSMGVGSLLSEHSASEYLKSREVKHGKVIIAGLIMFVSYFVTGFVPLAPYLFLSPGDAIFWSIIVSLVALFAIGVISAKVFKINILRKGLEMLLIGGFAILIGVLVGGWAEQLLGS